MRSDGATATGGTPARRRNRFAQVVDELGRRIVSGDFDGSGVLPIEPQLAAELGVSRNVLREAVKVAGEQRPGRGAARSAARGCAPSADWHLLDPDVLAWLDGSDQRLSRVLRPGRVPPDRRAEGEPTSPRLRATPAEKRTIAEACAALEACVGQPERVPDRDIAFHRSIHLGVPQRDPEPPGLADRLADADPGRCMTTEQPGLVRARPAAAPRADGGDRARKTAPAAEDASRRLVQMPYDDLAGRPGLRRQDCCGVRPTRTPGSLPRLARPTRADRG